MGKMDINLLKEIANNINHREEIEVKNFYYKGKIYPFSGETLDLGKEIDQALFFIDGSHNQLLRISGREIYKVRIAIKEFFNRKINIIEGYAVRMNEEINSFGELKKYIAKFKGEIDDYRAEIERAIAKTLKGVVVMDGTLEEMERNNHFIAMSKDSSILMNNNEPAIMYLSRKGRDIELFKGFKYGDINIDFLKIRKRVYRIDSFDRELMQRVIPILIKSSVKELMNYPYPLIEVHKLCVISNQEVRQEAMLLRTMIKDVQQIEDIHDYLE